MNRHHRWCESFAQLLPEDQHTAAGAAVWALSPLVAMLPRIDFDSGNARTDLFRDCPMFSEKVVLLDHHMWLPGTHRYRDRAAVLTTAITQIVENTPPQYRQLMIENFCATKALRRRGPSHS
jgi:hypothetical protein